MRSSLIRLSTAVLLSGALTVGSSAALAHVGQHAAGFAGGLAHPLTGLDHILAMLAVGLWVSQLERPARWLLPLAFPGTMAAGASLAIAGFAMPAIEPAIAASVLMLGVFIACTFRPSMIVAAAVVVLVALVHGHGHGLEAPAQGSLLAYCIGFVVTTLTLQAIGFAAGVLAARAPPRLAAHAAGAAIAVTGIALLFAA